MDDLAGEVLANIFIHIKGSDLKSLRLVCRAFSGVATRQLFAAALFRCDPSDNDVSIPGIGDWAGHSLSRLARSLRLQARTPTRSARLERLAAAAAATGASASSSKLAQGSPGPLFPISNRLNIISLEYGPDLLVVDNGQPVYPPVAEQLFRLAASLSHGIRCLTLANLHFGGLSENGRIFGPFPMLEELRLHNVSVADASALGAFIELHAWTLKTLLFYGFRGSTEARKEIIQLLGAATSLDWIGYYSDVITTSKLPSIGAWLRLVLEAMRGGSLEEAGDLRASGYQQGFVWRRNE